jgi:hypothetical protein
VLYEQQVLIHYHYIPITILLLTQLILLLRVPPSAAEPSSKRQCAVVPLHSQQIHVVYTGGKVLGKGGQTTGIVAGVVEFGSSGMKVPIVVKKYDQNDPSSVTAMRQEFLALTELKKVRSVVRLLGMCAEGLVLERLPLDLRDLFEAEHKFSSTYQIQFLLDRPNSTAAKAKEFISKVNMINYVELL